MAFVIGLLLKFLSKIVLALVAMAQAAFYKKKTFDQKIVLKFERKLVECHFWGAALKKC